MPLIHFSLSFSSGPGWPRWLRPILLVQDADDLSRVGHGQGGVQVHTPGQPAGVDRARSGSVQAGEIERGGILDDQQDVLVEAPLGGFNGEPEL